MDLVYEKLTDLNQYIHSVGMNVTLHIQCLSENVITLSMKREVGPYKIIDFSTILREGGKSFSYNIQSENKPRRVLCVDAEDAITKSAKIMINKHKFNLINAL